MTTTYTGWAEKVAAEIAAEKRAADPVASTETMRLATIRREAARRGASDDTVSSILQSLMVVNADGDLVERDTGKPMDQFLDEMQGTNPAYFGKPATAETAPVRTSVVLNPGQPGFNLSQAFAAARSDPHLYDELMRSLAPKPMRVF